MYGLIERIFIGHGEGENFRRRAIFLSGIVGTILNIILAAAKLSAGMIIGSISITADGVNNLFDSVSSVMASVSAKVSVKEPDEEHPYGHGRFEYIAALIVSFVVVVVGFEILQESIARLFGKSPSVQTIWGAVLMAASVLVKIWMVVYNKALAKKYDSPVNSAIATDSFGDAIAGIVITQSLAIMYFVDLPLDAISGIVLAVYIMYSGYQIAREMIAELMGTTAAPEVLEKIEKIILADPDVLGMHDCYIHNYGSDVSVGSVHVEIDSRQDLVSAHETVDRLEEMIMEKFGIEITMHIDPVTADENGQNKKPVKT